MPTHPDLNDPAVAAEFAARYRRDGMNDTEIQAQLEALPGEWRAAGFTPESEAAGRGPSTPISELRASTAGVRADRLAATQDWEATKAALSGKPAISTPLTAAELTPAGLKRLGREQPERLNAHWDQVAPILAANAKKGATK